MDGKWEAIIIQNFLFLDRTFFSRQFKLDSFLTLFSYLRTFFFIVTRFAHSIFNLKIDDDKYECKNGQKNCFVYSVTMIAHVDTDWKVKHATLVNILSLKKLYLTWKIFVDYFWVGRTAHKARIIRKLNVQ